MMNNQKVSAVSAVDVASVGRREAERSEADRSSTDAGPSAAPQAIFGDAHMARIPDR